MGGKECILVIQRYLVKCNTVQFSVTVEDDVENEFVTGRTACASVALENVLAVSLNCQNQISSKQSTGCLRAFLDVGRVYRIPRPCGRRADRALVDCVEILKYNIQARDLREELEITVNYRCPILLHSDSKNRYLEYLLLAEKGIKTGDLSILY